MTHPKTSPHWDRILAGRQRGSQADLGESIDSFLRRTLNIQPEEDLEYALSMVEKEIDSMESPDDHTYESYSPDQLAQAMFKTLQTWGWTFENESFGLFLRKLCDYFSSENDKGLFIIGPPGLGKSKTMQLMSKMVEDTDQAFKQLQVSYIVHNWIELEQELTRKIYRDWQRGDERKYHLLIDDIGREEQEKTYKYGRNPIRIAIEARHLLWERFGVKTHFITNFDPADDLMRNDWYGPALVDRMMGMSEVVEVEGVSKR